MTRDTHLCLNCGEKLESGEKGVCTWCLETGFDKNAKASIASSHASIEKLPDRRANNNDRES